MRRALLLFAAIGGIGLPVAFTLAGWVLGSFASDPHEALALLHDVQLPLWPMSKLMLADTAAKHWLYLPLAAVLSNALIYALVGAVSGWGRGNRAVFGALLVAVAALVVAAGQGFGSGRTGLLVALAIALGGLVIHHRGAPR